MSVLVSNRARRLAVLLALLAVAAWLALFGDKTPVGLIQPRGAGQKHGGAVAPSQALPPRTAARVPASVASEPVRIDALVPRRSWYEPERAPAADLFARAAWHVPPPPPPPPPAQPAPAPVANVPTPVSPPNYKVAGKQHDGRQWEVFLLRDENTFVVRSGQVIESTWRIEHIEPPSMTVVHVPTGQQHRIAIGDPM